jgi:hypothetical protein
MREPDTTQKRLEEIKHLAVNPNIPLEYREMLNDLLEMLRLTNQLANSRLERLINR